jgi:hypothetical protein
MGEGFAPRAAVSGAALSVWSCVPQERFFDTDCGSNASDAETGILAGA